jgi:hypothetical protein
VELFQATFDSTWLASARELADVMIARFWDKDQHGFFHVAAGHDDLLARSKDVHDNATPSGNAMAATALLRLGLLTSRDEDLQLAERTLMLCRGIMESQPTAAGQLLIALDYHLGPTREVVLVGVLDNPEVQQVLRHFRQPFQPRQLVALKPGTETPKALEQLIPLFTAKSQQGVVTAYICSNRTCRAPIVGARALAQVDISPT